MSIRKIVLSLCLPALLLCAAGCQSHMISQDWPDPDQRMLLDVRASVDVGQAKHVEASNLQDLDSDWESVLFRPRVVADLRTRSGFEASAELSGFFTNNEDEDWKLNGTKLSDNELEMTASEFRALAGWGTDIEGFGRVSLLGGFAARFVDLERGNLAGGGTSEFDADMYIAEGELRLSLPIRSEMIDRPVFLKASAAYGRLIDPQADVDGAGTIEGERGWIFRARVGLDFQVNEKMSLYLGGFFEELDIEGGTEGADEWPDSQTTLGGGEFGLRVRF